VAEAFHLGTVVAEAAFWSCSSFVSLQSISSLFGPFHANIFLGSGTSKLGHSKLTIKKAILFYIIDLPVNEQTRENAF
jgi:hypothetical protein